MSLEIYQGNCNCNPSRELCNLTARQYGEVVVPDDSTGQGPGTLARKLSRRAPRERSEQRGCKKGMACFLPSGYRVLLSFTSFAVQSCQGVSQLSRCS